MWSFGIHVVLRLNKNSLAYFLLAFAPFAYLRAQSSNPNESEAASKAAADPVMPNDPNAAMALATRVNGLGSPDMKPWHLKARYQTFDVDGKPKDQGVFEEWWAGAQKYKVSYSGRGFNQVEYRNGDKKWITGDPGLVPVQELMIEQYLMQPLPDASVLQKQAFHRFDRKLGANVFRCLQPGSFAAGVKGLPGTPQIDENVYVGAGAGPVEGVSAACFDPKAAMVRVEIVERGDLCVLFDNVLQVKGHYVAEQIWVKNGDLPILHVSLAGLDFPPEIRDAEIAPPASAVAVPVEQPAGLLRGRKVGGRDVGYPTGAMRKRVQGTVMLEATITKAGAIENLRVISGPSELQKPAYDAVKTWKYKPWVLNGEPVEMRMMVDVAFTAQR